MAKESCAGCDLLLLPTSDFLRCPSLISAQLQGPYRGSYRNGSVFRDLVPLWCLRLSVTPAT